jgi:hypothetical protein
MTALLFYSYSSKLTEAEKLTIDKEVIGNRVAVIKFVKKAYVKGKVIVISTTLGILILVSTPKNVDAIGLSTMPQAPMMRQSTESVPSYARLTVEKQNKIIFLKNERVPQSDRIYFDLPENHISTVDELVKLRGGDMSPLTKALFRLMMIWAMSQGHTPTKGFQPGRINPGFGHPGQVQPAPRIAPKLQENPLNRNNPGQGSCRAKQNNQDGTLTREQRRNLPSPDDVIISEQNVIIRDGQARYKIKNHGHEFGIESTQNSKGRFKTEKTPENVQAFKEEIKNLVLNGERIEGTYRKAEPDGYPASHFYDPKTGKNAIFKKQTKEFVSAWKLTEGQVDDLLTNGNVGDY